mmetsp:Transcript_8813/g.7878  ORF Transcript_8813/g.7878 Transcript_8813/m.7878 type:complete len:221 (+) Transcript_8813:42-704(+)
MIKQVTLDEALLKKKFNHMNLSNELGNTSQLTMQDILNKMTEVKQKQKDYINQLNESKKKPYIPPGGWKIPPNTNQPKRSPINTVNLPKTNTIARFRPISPKWNCSTSLGELDHVLYRTPDTDPSGERIFSLSRPTSPLVWKPNLAHDRDFNDPPLDSLPSVYRKHLINHLDHSIEKIKQEYDKTNSFIMTERNRQIKAKIGADLYNLQRTKEKLRNTNK